MSAIALSLSDGVVLVLYITSSLQRLIPSVVYAWKSNKYTWRNHHKLLLLIYTKVVLLNLVNFRSMHPFPKFRIYVCISWIKDIQWIKLLRARDIIERLYESGRGRNGTYINLRVRKRGTVSLQISRRPHLLVVT